MRSYKIGFFILEWYHGMKKRATGDFKWRILYRYGVHPR